MSIDLDEGLSACFPLARADGFAEKLLEERWKIAAHHEAGHLAMAWAFGWPFNFCRIFEDDGEVAGEIFAQWGDEGDPRTRAIICLAGPFAEMRYRGLDAFDPAYARAHWWTDTDGVRAALARLGPINLDRLLARVDRLVLEAWPKIERIADALLRRRRLEFADVAAIVEKPR